MDGSNYARIFFNYRRIVQLAAHGQWFLASIAAAGGGPIKEKPRKFSDL